MTLTRKINTEKENSISAHWERIVLKRPESDLLKHACFAALIDVQVWPVRSPV